MAKVSIDNMKKRTLVFINNKNTKYNPMLVVKIVLKFCGLDESINNTKNVNVKKPKKCFKYTFSVKTFCILQGNNCPR